HRDQDRRADEREPHLPGHVVKCVSGCQTISATKTPDRLASICAVRGSDGSSVPAGSTRGRTRWRVFLPIWMSASPAASTFLTQFVLPWASPIASTVPLRYGVTIVSYSVPEVRPRCLITP